MIKIWKYKTPGKSFKGFHLSADTKFLKSLDSVNESLTIDIDQPSEKDLEIPNHGSEIKTYKYLKMRLTKNSDINIINETIELSISPKLKDELITGISTIQNDIGDYSIQTDTQQHIWFWGI